MEELLNAYKEYTEFLKQQIISLLAIAKVHGWTNERGEQGRILREKIESLESNFSKKELDWFDEWYSLWPDGIKNVGKLIKQDKELCEKKMKVFIRKYNFGPSDIIKATGEYLNERAADNYAFTMLSSNFISHREKGSLLAERCKALKNNKPKEDINNSYKNQDLI